MLQSIMSQGCNDLKTLTMILNFLGNCIEEADADYTQKIIQETCLIEALSFFAENKANLKSEILSHIIWIEQNIINKQVKNKINMKENEIESCMRLASVVF